MLTVYRRTEWKNGAGITVWTFKIATLAVRVLRSQKFSAFRALLLTRTEPGYFKQRNLQKTRGTKRIAGVYRVCQSVSRDPDSRTDC